MRKFSKIESQVVRKVTNTLARRDCVYSFRHDEIADPATDRFSHTFCNIIMPARENPLEICDLLKVLVAEIDPNYVMFIDERITDFPNPSITIEPIKKG